MPPVDAALGDVFHLTARQVAHVVKERRGHQGITCSLDRRSVRALERVLRPRHGFTVVRR